MGFKEIKVNKTKTITNTTTPDGELLSSTEEIHEDTILVNDKEEFAFVYMSAVSLFKKLDKSCVNIMTWCMLNAKLDSNVISLQHGDLDLMSKEYEVSHQTLRNAIVKLSKIGALTKEHNARYIVHPNYSWKGNKDLRKATAKIVINLRYKNEIKKIDKKLNK